MSAISNWYGAVNLIKSIDKGRFHYLGFLRTKAHEYVHMTPVIEHVLIARGQLLVIHYAIIAILK